MSEYNLTITLDADSLMDAWDKVTVLPRDFATPEDWRGISYFSLYEESTGREFTLTNTRTEEENK